MNTVDNLDAELVAAFPAIALERASINEPTSLWDVYDDHAEIVALAGKTWRELPSELLFRHPSLLVYAGDGLFRAVLPAYLRYLLHERERFNALPFQVAGQLTRTSDPDRHKKFDRRIALLTAPQRAVIRNVLELLSTVRPMEEPMTEALATWKQL